MGKQISNKTWAFSVPEVLICLGLLGVVLLVSVTRVRLSPGQKESQSLAMEVKGLMSRARSQASLTGIPVGLVFPTDGNPIVRGCALFSGWERARFQREIDFTGNHPQAGIFLGQWNLPAPMSFDSPDTPPGADPVRLNLSHWLPDEFSDQTAIVFMPSGKVVSNRLEVVNREFPLVVADRIDVAGNLMTRADHAYTVLVSTEAVVRLEKGVLGGAVPEGGDSADSWPTATLSLLPFSNTAAPVVKDMQALPAPVDPAFAAAKGAECIVEPGGVVTLRVFATDVDGGPLYCRWRANAGSFSHLAETPMFYSPESQGWTSEWHWQAPATAAADEIIELTAEIRDESFAATVEPGVVTTPRILVVDPGRIVFDSGLGVSFADPTQRAHVFVSRYDGTGLKAIFESVSTGGVIGKLNISRDGRRVAVGTDYGDRLKLMSSDGLECIELGAPGVGSFPCFSEDSTKLYVIEGALTDPAAIKKYYSFDSLGNVVSHPSPFPGAVAGWSPSGDQALVQRGHDVVVCNSDGSIDAVVHDMPGTGESDPSAQALEWNSQGIFYLVGQDWDPSTETRCELYRASDSSDWSIRTHLGAFNDSCDIAREGRSAIHVVDDGIACTDFDTGLSRIVLPKFITVGPDGFVFGLNSAGSMREAIASLACSR